MKLDTELRLLRVSTVLLIVADLGFFTAFVLDANLVGSVLFGILLVRDTRRDYSHIFGER